jgi:uncharacterized protein involved in exopolysaccharide biosynthesis/Mrp family chromosome partitioning ATPase
MELISFLRVLPRYKKALILIPLITVVITFLLVRNLPKTYRSTSRIATGLVERSDEFINKNVLMENKVSQEFSNILQMMMLKRVVNQVSYQLIIHDLTAKEAPYRKNTKLINELDENERRRAVELFTQKYKNMEELSLWEANQKALNKLLVSKEYDYESLTKKLNTFRLQTSDYIFLEFESENPMLSAVVLNTLCREFISYYTSIVNQKKEKTVAYLDSSLKVREAALTAKLNTLKNYKIRNRILDVNNQANVLMTQIADFQSKRQEALKNITAYSSVLQNINSKLSPTESKSLEKSITQSNQSIIMTRNRLNALNEEYIKNNFDVKYKARIDSLQNVLAASIDDANTKSTFNTSTEKEDLVKEKLNTEIQLEMAKNSVESLDDMVSSLSGKLNVLAPNQANIQTYEKDIENESREYVDLVNKFNQTKLESSFPIRLRQVEMAMPETALPSKKILLVILAGMVSFLFTVLVLFVMYYIDHSINDTQQLADRTQIPVLGTLGVIKGASLDPDALWDRNNNAADLREFKSQLRSIRFEIDNDLAGSKVIAVTGLQSMEGKTFVTFNLAYAYKMINKKVLLIDGNFDNPSISQIMEPDLFLEDFLNSSQEMQNIPDLHKHFVLMGNKGEDISLFEISNFATIQAKFEALRALFDVILIEIPSLDVFNKAREWVSFTDKVIPVFNTGQNFTEAKKKEVEYLASLNGKVSGWIMNKVIKDEKKHAKEKPAKKAYA